MLDALARSLLVLALKPLPAAESGSYGSVINESALNELTLMCEVKPVSVHGPLTSDSHGCVKGYGVSPGANGRVAVKGSARGLDSFESAVLALNLPASSAGVNYQFTQGSYICIPNLYSSSGAYAACLHALRFIMPAGSLRVTENWWAYLHSGSQRIAFPL